MTVMVGLVTTTGILTPAGPASAESRAHDPQTYSRECDTGPSETANTCTVTFPPRTVKPLDGEKMDHYICPGTHRYLENKYYSEERGIEIRGQGPFQIEATISNILAIPSPENPKHPVAIGSGDGTVINWNTDPRDYGITLHCTKNLKQSYDPTPRT